MNSFARDTRQRLHLLETQEDADALTKKFLSTQLSNLVPVKQLYPFVGDDYEAVEYRAPGALDTYATYKHIAPEELFRLVNNDHNYKYACENVPAFEDFVEKVQPPKGKEVYAFFVHGQRKKNLAEHVDYMTDDVQERKRIYKAIEQYTTPQNPELVNTLGKFLQEIHVGPSYDYFIEVVSNPQKDLVKNPKDLGHKHVEEEEEDTSKVELAEHGVPTDVDLWENPILKAFKVEAGLATQFCNVKASKQALISMFAPCETHCVEKHLGRYQSEVPKVSKSDGWEHLLSVYSASQLQRITQTEQAQAFYRRSNQDKPKSNYEWVKRMLDEQPPLSAEIVNILSE